MTVQSKSVVSETESYTSPQGDTHHFIQITISILSYVFAKHILNEVTVKDSSIEDSPQLSLIHACEEGTPIPILKSLHAAEVNEESGSHL